MTAHGIGVEVAKWMAKARTAVACANLLLDTDGLSGACDRAFIAMYSATCAAVLHAGHELGKTHQGVIGTFIEHVVKNRSLPSHMVRMLKMAENRRYQANHSGDEVTRAQADEVVRNSSTFVAAVHTSIGAQPERL